jgi:hypothetical protein
LISAKIPLCQLQAARVFGRTRVWFLRPMIHCGSLSQLLPVTDHRASELEGRLA